MRLWYCDCTTRLLRCMSQTPAATPPAHSVWKSQNEPEASNPLSHEASCVYERNTLLLDDEEEDGEDAEAVESPIVFFVVVVSVRFEIATTVQVTNCWNPLSRHGGVDFSVSLHGIQAPVREQCVSSLLSSE